MPTIDLIGDSILWGYGLTATQSPIAKLSEAMNGTGSATAYAATPWDGQNYDGAHNYTVPADTSANRSATCGTWSVYGACVPGHTSSESRFAAWSTNVATREASDYAFLMFGANDLYFAETEADYYPGYGGEWDIQANVTWMVGQLKARGTTPYVCTMTPQDGIKGVSATRFAGILDYNAWVRNSAVNLGCGYVECYTTLEDSPGSDSANNLTIDTLHLDTGGVTVVTDLFKTAISGAPPVTVTTIDCLHNGAVRNTGANWGTIHDAASGSGMEGSDVTSALALQSQNDAGTFYIDRSFYSFDAAAVPGTDTISKVEVGFAVTYNFGSSSTSYCIFQGAQGDSLAEADYDAFTSLLATCTTLSLDTKVWTDITGVADANGGVVKLCVRESDYEVPDSAPGAGVVRLLNIAAKAYATTALRPQIRVTHSTPTPPSTACGTPTILALMAAARR